MQNHRLVLPEHLNQFGFLFGGYLLKWVDELAWMAASLEHPGCLFVTVGMKEVSFHKSVNGGSILRFESKKVRQGTTSVTYEVIVLRDSTEIFSTEVTLVHVDSSGQKQPVPS
ncbi:MAG: acyl-CoA thioesterase [Verrucomicrobiales bacterium]|nr:acyl-CoA thioesterase [Verrucomicrobiales bacterium]